MTPSKQPRSPLKPPLDLKTLPNVSGVYLMKDAPGRVIYVGKAKNLRKRVSSYYANQSHQTAKTLALVRKIKTLEYIITNNEEDAFLLENTLIKEQQPLYNIQLRDDKTYPFIKLTKEEYPRLLAVRHLKNDGARYFGPFSAASEVKKALKILRRYFPLRSCKGSQPGRPGNTPCLNYHMQRCLAPCKFTPRARYQTMIEEISLLLAGKQAALRVKLRADMKHYADTRDYESAAVCRDKLAALEMLHSRQKVVFVDRVERDIIGIAQEGGNIALVILVVQEGVLNDIRRFFWQDLPEQELPKLLATVLGQAYFTAKRVPREIVVPQWPPEREILEKWLANKVGYNVKLIKPVRGAKRDILKMAQGNAEELLAEKTNKNNRLRQQLQRLQEVLGLPTWPQRIEAYDISNLQGQQSVGGQVTFEHGEPQKEAYRRYHIRTSAGKPDDPQAIYEVISRRLQRLAREKKFKPDLILIDGGPAQLNAALRARDQAQLADIPIIGLAKREEDIYLAERPEPLKLPTDDIALLLLRRIRDEVHRFAITFHRQTRSKHLTG